MTTETNVGNLGSFNDLLTCMVQEQHNSVDVFKLNYWGINLKYTKDLKLSISEVRKIVGPSW